MTKKRTQVTDFLGGSKADALGILGSVSLSAKVLPQLCIDYSDFVQRPEEITRRAKSTLKSATFAIRSSAFGEDNFLDSHAGKYLTLLDVPPADILEAVGRVFGSYVGNVAQSQVLLQPMLRNVSLAGVAFTHDETSGYPYRRIEYSVGSDTAAVTSGKSGTQSFTFVADSDLAHGMQPELARVGALLDELLDLSGGRALDIEFAFCEEDGAESELYLLQARQLFTMNEPVGVATLAGGFRELAETTQIAFSPKPNLLGRSNVLSVMSDWNPAEIIGINPKPLAFSLYRDAVTDSIWSFQRMKYGYRDLRGFPLIRPVGGKPYVDVRVSLNSLIPSDIPDELAEKLIESYLQRLRDQPALHDKIEFKVAITSLTFSTDSRLAALRRQGFSDREISEFRQALRSLTSRVLHPIDGIWKSDVGRIMQVKPRLEILKSMDLPRSERLHWILEDLRRYGTLPFAGIARAAFMAVDLLKSMVQESVITEDESDSFYLSLRSVGKQLNHDYRSLEPSDFLGEYGHLRPGTYEIAQPSYREFERLDFIDTEVPTTPEFTFSEHSLSGASLKRLGQVIVTSGLDLPLRGLFESIRLAIEMRETAKFEFTRLVSAYLDEVKDFGEEMGIARADLSYLRVSTLKDLPESRAHARDSLLHDIDLGKKLSEQSASWRLPEVILSPAEIYGFGGFCSIPNFITHKSVTAAVSTEVRFENPTAIDERIVIIESADPGFDWIFTRPIAGLVTCWGGANSHMAIRCNELGIPAAIGIGASSFKEMGGARLVLIDCAAKRVEAVE